MLRVSKDCVFPSSSVILPSIAGGLSWCELAVVMRARQAPCDSQLREIYAGDRRFIRGANRKESDWPRIHSPQRWTSGATSDVDRVTTTRRMPALQAGQG